MSACTHHEDISTSKAKTGPNKNQAIVGILGDTTTINTIAIKVAIGIVCPAVRCTQGAGVENISYMLDPK